MTWAVCAATSSGAPAASAASGLGSAARGMCSTRAAGSSAAASCSADSSTSTARARASRCTGSAGGSPAPPVTAGIGQVSSTPGEPAEVAGCGDSAEITSAIVIPLLATFTGTPLTRDALPVRRAGQCPGSPPASGRPDPRPTRQGITTRIAARGRNSARPRRERRAPGRWGRRCHLSSSPRLFLPALTYDVYGDANNYQDQDDGEDRDSGAFHGWLLPFRSCTAGRAPLRRSVHSRNPSQSWLSLV